MSADAYVHRLIADLQAVTMWSVFSDDPPDRLAAALEWVLALPPERRHWNVPLIGHEEHDRLLLADWLEQQAYAPAYCAPSWTRGFSEIMAWVLRRNYPVTDDGIRAAMREMRAVLREWMRSGSMTMRPFSAGRRA